MAILEELKAKAGGKADQANNIQEAISMMEFGGGSSGGGVFFVEGELDYDQNGDLYGTLDKTWQEIHDAMLSKICIVLLANDNSVVQNQITAAYVGGPDDVPGGYIAMLGVLTFSTSTANGFPARGGGR